MTPVRLRAGLLALALATGTTLAATPETTLPWAREMREFEERDAKAPPPPDAALFVGSSSIRMWTTLAQDFPEIRVVNRGFGGSQIVDCTCNAALLVHKVRPRIIVMYAGTNDINGGKAPKQVLRDFQGFVARVRATQPRVPIAWITINPNTLRWDQRERQMGANALVADWIRIQPGLTFMDTWTVFLRPDGTPNEDLLLDDKLHLNAEGYKAWTAAVKPMVLRLYRETAPVGGALTTAAPVVSAN